MILVEIKPCLGKKNLKDFVNLFLKQTQKKMSNYSLI